MTAQPSPSTFLLSSTRRQWIAGLAVVVGSAALVPADSWAAADDGVSHSAEAIHQETAFKAPAKRVYDALTDAAQFQRVELLCADLKAADLKAKPAVISREVGGSFSLFGDYIVGRQLELVPNQRIVQAWRVTSWPTGIFSIARFELQELGTGTKLIFDHTGFPSGLGEHLASGWVEHYWEPLQKFLG
ncbi:MAG TPA: SRPBCC domain-containing protein [Candidatus Angelobacter sp.]|nr:SRPBCC domain-containing protein [Candidatus Angelobacter sp.]